MVILQIEHRIPDYEKWKELFDSDPIDRKGSGVKRYEVHRHMDDPNHVVIYLHFDNVEKAQLTLQALEAIWKNMAADIMTGAQTRIVELVDSKEL